MKKKITLFFLFLFLIIFGTFIFFDLEFPNCKPRPISIIDVETYVDVEKKVIHYNTKLTSTIYYNQLLPPWKRSGLEDSLHRFNKKIMDIRFIDELPIWNSAGIANEILVPNEKFNWNSIIDSSYHKLETVKDIKIQIWIEKTPQN